MAEPDLDNAIPVRQHQYLEGDDGRVAVLVPRFTGGFARRFLVPLLARAEIRMHLDELGSAVWRACDGHATVADVTRLVQAARGGNADDVRRRVHFFLRQLVREGSLSFLVKEHD